MDGNTPQSWLDTPAAQMRQLAGLPLPGEDELRFNGELEERRDALRRFNEAHRPGEATPDATPFQRQQELAAARTRPGSDWIVIGKGEETTILKRLRMQAEAARIASTAGSFGPSEHERYVAAVQQRVAGGVQ